MAHRGFTLLEMCIVLLILAILMGVISPGIQSAFAEQGLRSDASQLSLMVKTAMLQTAEEHRAYVLDLTETSLTLAPLGASQPETAKDTPSTNSADPPSANVITQTWKLGDKNRLLLPDPKANGDWRPIESAEWIFRPGGLCPATAVCFTRGEARLQMSFNALTGNVEDERSFIP